LMRFGSKALFDFICCKINSLDKLDSVWSANISEFIPFPLPSRCFVKMKIRLLFNCSLFFRHFLFPFTLFSQTESSFAISLSLLLLCLPRPTSVFCLLTVTSTCSLIERNHSLPACLPLPTSVSNMQWKLHVNPRRCSVSRTELLIVSGQWICISGCVCQRLFYC
jgi:hypothetical protein